MPYLIWMFHLFFWIPFLGRGVRERREGKHGEPTVAIHPRSTALLVLHSVAMFLVYFGIGAGWELDHGFGPREVVGAVVIQLGTLLAQWTLRTFHSWRVPAEIGVSHRLQTNGPFAWVRHPIYAAMNLLCLGSFIWRPHPIVLAGFVLGWIVGELRARAEEGLLIAHFGDEYRAYMARTRRFLPGIY